MLAGGCDTVIRVPLERTAAQVAGMSRCPSDRCPFCRFFFGWEGLPTKIDKKEKVGTLILTFLQDLDVVFLEGRG